MPAEAGVPGRRCHSARTASGGLVAFPEPRNDLLGGLGLTGFDLPFSQRQYLEEGLGLVLSFPARGVLRRGLGFGVQDGWRFRWRGFFLHVQVLAVVRSRQL